MSTMTACAECIASAHASGRRLCLLAMLMSVGCSTVPERHPPASSETHWGSHGSARKPRVLLASDKGLPVAGESTGQPLQGYLVPGRNADSQMPWEFFLGHAAHSVIAYMYGLKHPNNRIFYNTASIVEILRTGKLGDPSRLLPYEREIRPDITDLTWLYVFEIKPWNEQGLREGRQKVQAYLDALNRAMVLGSKFSGGLDFHGEILIRFAQGQYIWRLEWRTTEPGVIQYRWTRSKERFDSEAAAHKAGQWVELSRKELIQYGGWVAIVVEDMIHRREQLATFSGVVGIVIDFVGDTAVWVFSSAFGRRSMTPGKHSPPMQPPNQGDGKVIPFPGRTAPSPPPAKRPAAGSW